MSFYSEVWQQRLVNYRHQFHAGNFADVMKHALLVQLVRGLQRKPAGALFLDTHAGRGGYDLDLAATGDTQARKPEHPEGIGRLWRDTTLPAELSDYVELVRSYDSTLAGPDKGRASPRFYPGSPQILKMLARDNDRLTLWEKHPEECERLRKEVGWAKRVAIQEGDGYGALRAALPPPEKRALILIDPPYEDATESSRVRDSLREGLERFPSGVFAIWYPLTRRSVSTDLVAGIRELNPPPTLVIELTVRPESTGLSGCGVVVVNPPWKFDETVAPMLQLLAKLLSQGPNAKATLRWLVPE